MNCDEVKELIDVYSDGELDVLRAREVERHRDDCPDCAALLRSGDALKAALKSNGLYYAAPAALESRIRQALPAEPSDRQYSVDSPARWSWLGATAALMTAAFLIGGYLHPFAIRTASDISDPLLREALSDHVRSLMASHLLDVVSTDQHTVKPWFSGKLDFSPIVADLRDQGFPLIGGRLDTLDGRPVAALVYQRHKHVINVFVRPTDGTSRSRPADITRQGYHIISWSAADMDYCAVSDVNEDELRQFVRALQQRIAAS